MPVTISDKTLIDIVRRNFEGETLTEIAESLDIPQPRISEAKAQRSDTWNSIIEALTHKEIRNLTGEGALIDEDTAEENYQITLWVTSGTKFRLQIIENICKFWCLKYPNAIIAEQRLKEYESHFLCQVPEGVIKPSHTLHHDGKITNEITGETTNTDGTVSNTRPRRN